jgi:hypothetical protein
VFCRALPNPNRAIRNFHTTQVMVSEEKEGQRGADLQRALGGAAGGVERGNPLALGHIVNHPPAERSPNCMPAPLDIPLDDEPDADDTHPHDELAARSWSDLAGKLSPSDDTAWPDVVWCGSSRVMSVVAGAAWCVLMCLVCGVCGCSRAVVHTNRVVRGARRPSISAHHESRDG